METLLMMFLSASQLVDQSPVSAAEMFDVQTMKPR